VIYGLLALMFTEIATMLKGCATMLTNLPHR
jgi:hypothetical protein